MTAPDNRLDELCITTIRMLSADAVQQANSGHPGLPLGAAPAAYILWNRYLRHNPASPMWSNRDRFVLSAGHGSALLYSLLHLTGYDLSLDEVKNFRQWGSKTPGHPEYGHAPGIEATTGPLGQGVGMSVGMALAERFLATKYNKPDFPVVDHFTYALVSDGDLMEGIASEAASLAGHLKLGKLIFLYDDNHISIEGDTALAFTENVGDRFAAYGWHVQRVEDGNNLEALNSAIATARADDRPSIICIRSHIGYGSPKQDNASAHGEPLGDEALEATKKFFEWPLEPRFHIPDEVLPHMSAATEQGKSAEADWNALMDRYAAQFPKESEELRAALDRKLPAGWDADVPVFSPEDKPIATRAASGKVLNAIAARIPTMLGGSADLAPSNKTLISGEADHSADNPGARNIRYGVREHTMAAMVNGMALHGGVIPYCGTFLIFSDYMRPSLRLAALMDVPSIFIFTHDSLGVGEDGPTHQPIEHLSSLRAMPNFTLIRPADANETAVAWKVAIENSGPTGLALTRQGLPILDADTIDIENGVRKGAYVVIDTDGDPEVILIATGSELQLALDACKVLGDEHNLKARVVSMPCWELFEAQTDAYRTSVLPPTVKKRLAIEAGCTHGWERWVGDEGAVLGVDRFGASAPGKRVFKEYGFTTENVVSKAVELVKS